MTIFRLVIVKKIHIGIKWRIIIFIHKIDPKGQY